MKLIDLVVFAEHSQKLPSQFLEPEIPKNESSWKILAAHFIDLIVVFMFTNIILAIFAKSVEMILVTERLQSAFKFEKILHLSEPILPMTLFSYFFFSYFMNHGQTYGMFLLKKRVELRSKSFRECLSWALHSSLVCFSCGLTYLLKRSKWNSFKGHDYLYQGLMNTKESPSIDLVAKVEEFENEKKEETIYWPKAA